MTFLHAKGKVSSNWQQISIIISAILGFVAHVFFSSIPFAFLLGIVGNIFTGYLIFESIIFLLVFVPFARINKRRIGLILGFLIVSSSISWIIVRYVFFIPSDREYLFFPNESTLFFLLIALLTTIYFSLLIIRYVRKWSQEWNKKFEGSTEST